MLSFESFTPSVRGFLGRRSLILLAGAKGCFA